MKSWIKNTLIFAAGIAVGVGVTYFYLDKKINKYLDEYGQEPETEEIEEKLEEAADDEDEDIAPIDPEKEAEYLAQHERECEEEEEAMMSDAELAYASRDIYWEEMVKDTTGAYKEKDVTTRLITLEEFDEECDHYDKINLVYYNADQVLTELDDSLFEDEIRNLGKTSTEWFDVLDEMGRYGVDKDTLYIRNNRLRIDYEIQRVEGSYREYVLGEVDE